MTASPVSGGGPSIEVTPDNVLDVRRVILRAVEEARTRLEKVRHDLAIQRPADDRVSAAAAELWNASLITHPDSHLNRLMGYVHNVEVLAAQLEEAARNYGYTDEEIAASFHTL
jgi:hypothetical protein